MPPHTNTFVGSARPELAPCAKSKRAWMTASAPIYKSHKKEATERVESAPTCACVVSHEWPRLTRVWQTHDSIPGF